jgi:hypothetical protein
MTGTLLNVAQPYESWKSKAEEWLVRQFPRQIEAGWYNSINLGRNSDAAVTTMGGFKTTNRAMQRSALYLEVPDVILSDPELILNHDALTPTFMPRVQKEVQQAAEAQAQKLIRQGMKEKEARASVADAISKVGFYDEAERMYVIEPVLKSVHDSILSGMETPYWNISRIQKVFRKPILRGYADHLVFKVGVPNIWADLIQMFTGSYEGKARVAGRTTGEFNTSIAGKSRTGTMLSEIINLVIDYEYPQENEQRIGAMEGWLVGTELGERDVYATIMLEQLENILWYFGHDESGFLGLRQIADRDDAFDYYNSAKPPAQYMWEHEGDAPNTSVGADLLIMLNHFIADRMEELHFLPLNIRVSCAPVLWKALTFSMTNKMYNQNNPLSIINTAFESQEKMVGTIVSRSGKGLWSSLELVADPMLAPNTPFNDTDEDLMYMTFPSLQSEMGDQDELVMAPTLIDKMVLPSAPAYRDSQVRTAITRFGSLLCPLRKTVHILSGMGTNTRYVPPTP